MDTSTPTWNRCCALGRFGAALAAGIVLAASSPARSASVETFVLTIAGQAQLGPNFQCATGGPATAALAFFPNTTPGVPSDGLATCHVGGGYRTTTAPGRGPLSDVSGLSNSFGNPPPNTFSGTALSLARAGSVLASSNATFTGSFNSLLYEGAASYGVFEDRLTPTSPSVPNGTAGTLRLFFTVDGQLAVTGPPPASSTADVEVNYSVAGGPSFTLLRAQANRPDQVPFATSGIGDPLTGFTAAPGSFGGHGDIRTFPFAFVWQAGPRSIAGPEFLTCLLPLQCCIAMSNR